MGGGVENVWVGAVGTGQVLQVSKVENLETAMPDGLGKGKCSLRG